MSAMIAKGAWCDTVAPMDRSRLRCIRLGHWTFDGTICSDGEIIVLDAVALSVCRIFRQLLDRKFPVHRVTPIDDFDADDEASVLANNTSALCVRHIQNTSTPSVHSYGAAIDINPLFNPYIDPPRNPGGLVTLRDDKLDYLQRTPPRPGMVEPIVDIFHQNGFFVWGGHWSWPLDYHHFQTTRAMAKVMVALNPDHAEVFFNLCCAYPNQAQLMVWPDDGVPCCMTKAVLDLSLGVTAGKISRGFQAALEDLFIEALLNPASNAPPPLHF